MRPKFVCVCVCMYIYHIMSLESDSSETIEAYHNIVKLGMVTTSDMRMHHVLIILTLTFIQCHKILIMKIINVQLFQKLFKQCPSSLL